ncbi:uncharacterized protein LOC120155124 [Hibiscus syriacus]|uniref:uncharacterized protein LOC120155124 n=1 Tax=Hibiscus syriacus TaxID=106335 RepID=UPI0019212341|nr:uncharacterized protein LOC120155124 [Hibiscus syriacus]XP_039022624.1 uncharacterized protein LOC120155124 [Hibiscus syriacus]
MLSPCLPLCKNYCLGFHFHPPNSQNLLLSSSPFLTCNFPKPKASNKRLGIHSQNRPGNSHNNTNPIGKVTVKGKKENVWSIDNERAKAEKEKGRESTKQRRRRKGKRVVSDRKKKMGRVLVSAAMLMEVETVLQTQEPVIKPAWNTFASSVSGIWKGVGAVFSPITAEMEPIEIGNRNENLYDCYVLTHVEAIFPPSGKTSEIHRKINWVTLNPHGEVPEHVGVSLGNMEESRVEKATSPLKEKASDGTTNHVLPKFGSFDLTISDVMEEDVMDNEPGLVFFEDGSYSRGPLDIPVGEVDDSNYYLSPTFKFEQCLVKGCHKRLRIVHTMEFDNGGSDVQIMRVAVYEEEWVSPAHIREKSLNGDPEFDLKPFSQRKRTRPSELVGLWKVFEVSATPIYGDDTVAVESNGAPCAYLCMETLKKRSLPESSSYFREEEVLDMQDVTVLWLPGGVTSYVDVSNDGTLTIGVGWYSDEGINLVMERDYGIDGKLKEVRWKSEVKRRWADPVSL